MSFENLQRLVQMRDTKSNCEAFSGTLEEALIAYATDTGELGIYTNGAWVWIGAGGASTIGDLDDVTITDPADGNILKYATSEWINSEPSVGGILEGTIIKSSSISNTTDEVVIFTGFILADQFQIADVYQIHIFGSFSTFAASQSLTARVYVGSTEVAEIVLSPSNISNEPFHGLITITVRTIGAAGTVSVYSQFYVEGEHDSLDEEETIDTTTSNNITISFQWGAANAGNIVEITQGYMEIYTESTKALELLLDDSDNILLDDADEILYEG